MEALPYQPPELIWWLVLVAAVGQGAPALRGPRWAQVTFALGGAAILVFLGLCAWHLDAAPKVLLQIRLLGLFGGGALLVLVGAHGERRLVAGALLFAFALVVGPALPDAARLAAPWVAWGAAGAGVLVAALCGIGLREAASLLSVAPALVAWSTGTSAGLAGAVFVALTVAIALGEHPREHPRVRLITTALVGLGLGLAFTAAWIARPPFDLRTPTLITGAATLAGFALHTWGRRRGALPVALAGALGLAAGVAGVPFLALAGEGAAEAVSARALPPDDMHGWRRLWRLEHPPREQGPPDAGVP